jgi:two-component system chemotaxis response regulator CheY
MKKFPRRVLIVDDDAMMREALRMILISENHIRDNRKVEVYKIVGEASDGATAIDLFMQHSPDLVLMDINMPKMDGLQALEKIRQFDPSAKVMMVSVESKMHKVREAIMLGASGFVVKPLNAGNVLDRIEICFKEGTLK